MTRLINADELQHRARKYFIEQIESSNYTIDTVDCSAYIQKIIDWLPTVDAVPVVRCGWCKYFDRNYCKHPAQHGLHVMAGHFCGYGERKEG